ncbi:hypothetical protein [Streptomyces anthocyanicus]|uniref:hypothetical protein n=1 Tax=Streptomyces anthocyanicus TaxID=68174 RepID=UPI00324631D3
MVEHFTAGGFTTWMRECYTSEHLTVVNVYVPGMELFMLVTDGALALPPRHDRPPSQRSLTRSTVCHKAVGPHQHAVRLGVQLSNQRSRRGPE